MLKNVFWKSFSVCLTLITKKDNIFITEFFHNTYGFNNFCFWEDTYGFTLIIIIIIIITIIIVVIVYALIIMVPP